MKKAGQFIGLWLVGSLVIWGAGGCGNVAEGPVTANAGADRTVLLNTPAILDGQGSTGVTSARWSIMSSPSGSVAALSSETSLTPSLTPDVAGYYVIQLSVNDDTASDSVTITATAALVTITVPDGSAITTRERFGASEYVVDLGATGAKLSGASSLLASLSDLETKDVGAISYQWEQISGPSAKAAGVTTGETLEFTAPTLADFLNLSPSDRYKWQPLRVSRNDTKMIFRLTISDGTSSDSETIAIYLQDEGKEIHTSTGLQNVGIGTTVTLSGPSLNAAGASAIDPLKHDGGLITDWSWTLTPPAGSSTAFLDTGTGSSTLEFPSFIPDVPGLYLVDYNSATGNTGSTAIKTVKAPGTLSINAADYAGVGTVNGASPQSPQCATCHDGTPLSGLEDIVAAWDETKHAHMFESSMDIYRGLTPEPYLWEFHTVGYNKDANSNGFDDMAGAEGLTFPLTGLTFSEFTKTYPESAAFSNIQCENCHGPGSEHWGDPLRIAFSYSQYGVCGQCHVELDQWVNSAHNSTGVAHGRGAYQSSWMGVGTTNPGCTRCHSAKGYETFLEEGEEGLAAVTDDLDQGAFPGITCAACHDPHEAAHPLQLRLYGNVTLAIDGSTIGAGKAAVCYNCHDGNYALGEKQCDSDDDGVADVKCLTADQTAAQYWRGGYHYAVQSPILEGKQALRDLAVGHPLKEGVLVMPFTENSFHSAVAFTLAGVTGDESLPSENNKCVTCHMAQGPSLEEEGYQHLGGHAFKLRTGHGIGHLQMSEDDPGTIAEEEDLKLISACQICHKDVLEFNREARADYDGDGDVEGIQDEIKGLILNVSNKIKEVDVAVQEVPYTSDNINMVATAYNGVIGTTVDGAGAIVVDALAWKGDCSSFTGTTGAACGKDIVGAGSCTNVAPAKTREDYQQCNFAEADPILRRAVWNYNSVVRDGSLGIHNAAYAIQVLQKTYQALGFLIEGKILENASYDHDFPDAVIR